MNTYDLLKKIRVTDFCLLKTGIEITILHDCEEKVMELNPVESCRLLAETSMINHYRTDTFDPDVVLLVNTEAPAMGCATWDDNTTTVDLCWEAFINGARLTGYMAKVLAAQWLQEQATTSINNLKTAI